MEFRGTGPVRMTTIAKVKPGKRKEFLDVMGSLQEIKLNQNGAAASKCHEDRKDPAHFWLMDEWETREELRRYFLTDIFRVFLGALKTLCVEAEVKYGPLHGETENDMIVSFSLE